MAVIKVGNNSIGKISVIEPYDDMLGVSNSAKSETYSSEWVRPSEWLDMPTVTSGVAALIFVPSGNKDFGVSIRASCAGPTNNCPTHIGIDWGDGSSDLIYGTRRDSVNNANGFGYFHKKYDFDLLPENTQFMREGHPVRQVIIQLDGSASGISYFDAIGLNGSKFGSVSKNGVAAYYIDEYGSGIETTSRSVTSAGGSNSTLLDLHVHNSEGISFDFYSWNTSSHKNIENITLDVSGLYPAEAFDYLYGLRNVYFASGMTLTSTNASSMFLNCYRLTKVSDFDTSNVTNFSSMFNGCRNLSEIPSIDTSNGTTFSAMFSNCRSVDNIPVLDLSNGTEFNSMFHTNIQLTSLPSGLDFSNGQNFSAMFKECYRLQAVPRTIDFSNATNTSSMFYDCRNLKSIPAINAPNLTSATAMFQNCMNLQEVEVQDFGSATNLSNLFQGCYSLKKINWHNAETFQPTSMYYTYVSCSTLNSFPEFETSQATSFAATHSSNHSAVKLPTYDMSSCSTISSFAASCYNLTEVNFKNCLTKMSTAQSAFSYCRSLIKAPSGVFQDYNSTPSNIDYMFFACPQLEDVSEYIISGATRLFQPFNGCLNLKSGPKDVNCTTMAYLFLNCGSIERIGSYDLSNTTNLTAAFSTMHGLSDFDAYDMQVSFSLNNGFLGSGNITKVFNNLASGVTGQTVDIRNNYGASQLHTDTIAIATSKGWTVTT